MNTDLIKTSEHQLQLYNKLKKITISYKLLSKIDMFYQMVETTLNLDRIQIHS